MSKNTMSVAEEKNAQKAQRREEWKKQFWMYNPPTARYWRLRGLWAIAVLAAIVFFIVAFTTRSNQSYFPYVFLALADASLIFAGVIDFTKIRKERRRYQEEMTSKKSKTVRAAEKKRKREERESKKAAESKVTADVMRL